MGAKLGGDMDGAEFLAFISKLVTAYNNLKMKFWV